MFKRNCYKCGGKVKMQQGGNYKPLTEEELSALAHQFRGSNSDKTNYTSDFGTVRNSLGYLTPREKSQLQEYMNKSGILEKVWQGLPNLLGNSGSAAIPKDSRLKIMSERSSYFPGENGYTEWLKFMEQKGYKKGGMIPYYQPGGEVPSIDEIEGTDSEKFPKSVKSITPAKYTGPKVPSQITQEIPSIPTTPSKPIVRIPVGTTSPTPVTSTYTGPKVPTNIKADFVNPRRVKGRLQPRRFQRYQLGGEYDYQQGIPLFDYEQPMMDETMLPMDYMEDGGIYIKPQNRGKFTASANRAGMGVQEFARHVLANPEDYSPLQRKRANFARNAKSWS